MSQYDKMTKEQLIEQLEHSLARVRELEETTQHRRIDDQSAAVDADKEKTYITHSPYGIIVARTNGQFIQANPAACEMTGYAEEELVKLSLYDILKSEFLPDGKNPVDHLKKTGKLYIERQFMRNDGSLRWCSINAVALPDNTLVGFTRDITERKMASLAFETATTRLATALHSANIGLWDKNLFSGEYYVSPEWKQQLGLEAMEIEDPEVEWKSRLHPSDKKEVLDEWQGCLDSGSSEYRIELRLRHNDGSYRWFLSRGQVICDALKRPTRIIGCRIDITDIKNTKAELRSSQIKYNKLFVSMHSAFALHEILIDDKGRPEDFVFLEVNPAFEKMTGLKGTDIIGERGSVVIPSFASDELNWLERCGRVAETGESIQFEQYAKEFQKWYTVMVYSPQPGQFGTLFLDITEQKKMEDRIRQSEKMEAIGQLAGGIAHDFNNQLGGILGYTELLLEEIEDNEQLKDYGESILRGIKRSSDLTAQLLAFSRKGKYLHVTVDLHRVIFEVVSLLKHSIDKRVSIRQQLNADPATTLGDPTQLQNAILNLAINARDAMPKGGELVFETNVVTLDQAEETIGVEPVEPGRYVRICVRDTGIGMTKETERRIFEPFFTTKELGKGTGMGLAAVYGTVKNHKGGISVSSTLQKGTTFTIHLPLSTEQNVLIDKNQGSVPTKGSAHILLVEDDDTMRELGVELLNKLGYQVTSAKDGFDAVVMYRDHFEVIDLVIIDIVMPKMSGQEAFFAMKKINPDILAVLVSGYSLNADTQKLLDEGVKGFLQKPYRKAILSEELTRILNARE